MTAAATANPTGPTDVAAYSLDNYVADALAVMDATDAGKAILVGLSFGGMLASVLAAHHPERVKAAILVGTVASIGPPQYPYLATKHFMAKREQFDGWDKFNREHWLTDYPDFAEHFIRNIHSEPHSTKQIEDGIDWANDTSGPVLVKTVEARAIPPQFDVSEAMYRKIRCPMLIIHGDDDQIQPHARAQARGRGHRRRARDHSGRRSQSAGPLSRQDQRADRRLPRSQARHRGARKAGEPADDARPRRPSTSPPRSASGTGAAISRSRASCASCIPTCRSIGWRRIPSRACSKPAASASIRSARGSRASRGTSSWSRASTICTASRRSAAWTRC